MNFGILETGAGETDLSGDPVLWRALVIAFSSSTLKDPTGILEGVTGLISASCSLCLTYKT